jgi:ribose 5-phosphate isomerase RpiB
MILTQRQLEQLHTGNGHIVLPYRARLSPLALDWVRKKKIHLGYGDVTAEVSPKPGAASPLPAEPPAQAASYVWWCDGPCGPAKGAITNLSREANLREMQTPADAMQLPQAVKSLSSDVSAGKIDGGILLVKSGATAMILANRCSSLRAVLGTCIDSVEQGISQMAANVLVIEHPYVTLMQARNLMARFVKGKRKPTTEIENLIAQVSACACKHDHKEAR